ncbi:MAG TPA: PDZ domain-containing protein [Blastocatellia bacterium]|nr:PDZ domain-containing protein [Blastocatellia bacterium]
MSRSVVTALAFILATAGIISAQQQSQITPAQTNNPWIVSVVHTIAFQKVVTRMKQQEQGRLGVPASAPQFVYNFATGLVVDNEGHVVTRLANLDIEDKDQIISIATGDGASQPARLIGVDCATGFAVLEVASLKLGSPNFAATSLLSNGMGVKIFSTDVQGRSVPSQNGNKIYFMPVMRTAQGNIGAESLYSKARGAMTLFSNSLMARNDSSVVTTFQNQIIGIAQYAGFGRAYLFPVEFIRDTIAKRVIEKKGNVRAGWLGANGDNVSQLSESEATALGLSSKAGVVVRQVVEGSPAATSGILPNDVITGVDNFDIAGRADLVAFLQSSPEGRKIKLRAIRNHQPVEINVELGARADSEWSTPVFRQEVGVTIASQRTDLEKRRQELIQRYRGYEKLQSSKETQEALRELILEIRQINDALQALGPDVSKQPDKSKPDVSPLYAPSNASADSSLFRVGLLEVRDLATTPQLAARLGVKGGMFVRDVRKDSLAWQAGIRAGDVIVGTQDRENLTAETLQSLLDGQRGPIAFKIVRDNKPIAINLNNQ